MSTRQLRSHRAKLYGAKLMRDLCAVIVSYELEVPVSLVGDERSDFELLHETVCVMIAHLRDVGIPPGSHVESYIEGIVTQLTDRDVNP